MYESPFSASEQSTVLRAGLRYKRSVVLAIIVGVALGLAFGFSRDEAVSASTNLVLRDAAEVDGSVAAREQSGAYERFVESQELFANSDEVIDLVAGQLGVPVADIRSKTEVAARSGGEALRFTATTGSEDTASDLLERHVKAYANARAARIAGDSAVAGDVLESASAELGDDAKGTLSVSAVELAIATEIYGDGVSFADTVTLSEQGVVMGLVLPAAIGGLAAAALALLVASIVDDRNPLVQGSDSLRERHGLPVRGVVPTLLERQRQAYERLGADLEGAIERRTGPDARRAAVMLMIGVDDDRDDAVGTITKTSRSMADGGMRICIIDGSSDNKEIPDETASERFEPSSIAEVRIVESSSGGVVDAVRASSSNRTIPEYVRDPVFAQYMKDLNDRFDAVFVDCPSLAQSSAALKMARFCDGALLIVPAGTRMSAVDNTVYGLQQTDIELGGYISTQEPVSRRADHWWAH